MHTHSILTRYKLHHILFWLLVLGTWFFLRIDEYPSPAFPDRAMGFKITLIKVIDIALMIYITNYVLIPKLLYRKKWLLFGFVFVAMVFASSAIKMNILGRIMGNPGMYDLTVNFKARLYDNIIPHFFLVIAGAAVKLLLDYGQLQKRMAETAKEKAETELNFLKSQINPHFLFNSLNSVYFLIDKNNKDAREALHKFSEMLRYQLYEMNGDRIPVEKEISYLRDYVDLQKLRKDEHYSVEFNCSPQVKGFSIEPLLLVPFVENAFKHISHHTHKLNQVKLDMSRQNGEFRFVVENSKDSYVKNTEQAGGIGLGNVKRRLELLYPGKYVLDIDDRIESYKVELKLKL